MRDEIWVQFFTGAALQQATENFYSGQITMWYKRINSMLHVGQSIDNWRWSEFYDSEETAIDFRAQVK